MIETIIGTVFMAIMIIALLFCIAIIRNVDENGHDSWDRAFGNTDGYRGFAGIKYHDDGSYDFWGNVFDTNPWSINSWDWDD